MKYVFAVPDDLFKWCFSHTESGTVPGKAYSRLARDEKLVLCDITVKRRRRRTNCLLLIVMSQGTSFSLRAKRALIGLARSRVGSRIGFGVTVTLKY